LATEKDVQVQCTRTIPGQSRAAEPPVHACKCRRILAASCLLVRPDKNMPAVRVLNATRHREHCLVSLTVWFTMTVVHLSVTCTGRVASTVVRCGQPRCFTTAVRVFATPSRTACLHRDSYESLTHRPHQYDIEHFPWTTSTRVISTHIPRWGPSVPNKSTVPVVYDSQPLDAANEHGQIYPRSQTRSRSYSPPPPHLRPPPFPGLRRCRRRSGAPSSTASGARRRSSPGRGCSGGRSGWRHPPRPRRAAAAARPRAAYAPSPR
jgi:hypothetical protein